MEYWRYGNHPTVASHHNQLETSLAKEERYQYVIPLPSWVTRFIPNLHINPLGIIIKPGKEDRLVIDPSFRVSPSAIPANAWTSVTNEPPIRFADALSRHLVRIYNLRVTYSSTEILIFSDDASGAFKTTKLHPDVASAFAYAYGARL